MENGHLPLTSLQRLNSIDSSSIVNRKSTPACTSMRLAQWFGNLIIKKMFTSIRWSFKIEPLQLCLWVELSSVIIQPHRLHRFSIVSEANWRCAAELHGLHSSWLTFPLHWSIVLWRRSMLKIFIATCVVVTTPWSVPTTHPNYGTWHFYAYVVATRWRHSPEVFSKCNYQKKIVINWCPCTQYCLILRM